ncbi:DUF4267 domain-containing protein [Streptomyces sp. NPDC002187]|uniref:DUF4267 domain-containing protein n=1 Tax=Streptomyces sp. NPDC002187 TaxID=3364637 RepID=UPI0036C68E0A
MLLKKINTVLAAAFILFILWFGVEFILSPETTAPGFGPPSWPSGDGDGFLIIKGIRDVVLALVLGILLVHSGLGTAAPAPPARDAAPGPQRRLLASAGPGRRRARSPLCATRQPHRPPHHRRRH